MKNFTTKDQDWFIPRENVFVKYDPPREGNSKFTHRPRQAVINFLLAYSRSLQIKHSRMIGDVNMVLN